MFLDYQGEVQAWRVDSCPQDPPPTRVEMRFGPSHIDTGTWPLQRFVLPMFKVRVGSKNEGQTQTLDSGLVNSYNCSSHPAEAKDKDNLVTKTGIPVGCLPVALSMQEKRVLRFWASVCMVPWDVRRERGLVRVEADLRSVKYCETKKHSLLPNPSFPNKILTKLSKCLLQNFR